MTTLIVKPIDLSAPGSYTARKQFLRLWGRFQKSQDDRAPDEMMALLDEFDALVLSRLRTDDGSPVEDALDEISANQFDQLMAALAFENSVGEASGVPSDDGTGGTPRKSRRGKST